MTSLWVDGFEGQDSSSYYTNAPNYGTTTRFSYGRCATSSGGAFTMLRNITASTDIYIGFAYSIGTVAANTICELLADGGTVQHIVLVVNTNGSLEVRRGGTTLATSAAGIIANGAWNYIELHGKLSDTVGVADVRLNGNTTAVVTFSGDTKNGGTSSSIDAFRLSLLSSGLASFDDVYVNDGLGSVNNSWLGDMRVQYSVPTGAGSTTGLTASTGSNWQTVDEAPPSATDYSGSPTSGARDTYAMNDLVSGTASIAAVRACTFWHKSDAGAASMKQAMRIGGTVYYNSSVALPSSMGPNNTIMETSPATSSAFTVSEVNALEFGAEVV